MSKGKNRNRNRPAPAPEPETPEPESEAPAPEAEPKVAAEPVAPRQRGAGPICDKCGSGMTINATRDLGRTNHPMRDGQGARRVMVYYKCLNPDCAHTTQRLETR